MSFSRSHQLYRWIYPWIYLILIISIGIHQERYRIRMEGYIIKDFHGYQVSYRKDIRIPTDLLR
jgi:hypothetical protein